MPEYYDVAVSLRGVTPRIWRRFLIRASATFLELHEAVQDACGWYGYHRFAFRDDRARADLAGCPDDDGFGEPVPPASRVKLGQFFSEGGPRRCTYEYDFGDGWEHDVVVRRVVSLPESFKRRLIAGERAFPPEDCGGLEGYERCALAVLLRRDPWGEDVGELLEWLAGWHPEKFDLAAVKERFDREGRRRKAVERRTSRRAERR